MTPRSLFHAVLTGVAAATLLAACAGKPSGGSAGGGQQASAAQKAACRERADEVYAKQNRGELYSSDTYQSETRDAPFGNAGLPGITTRGLGSQYERDNLVEDCLNDAAGNVGNSSYDTAPAPSSAPVTPGKLPKTLSPLAVPPPPSP